MTDLKFEDCLARLEQIVGALEAGNLPLEESLQRAREINRKMRGFGKT